MKMLDVLFLVKKRPVCVQQSRVALFMDRAEAEGLACSLRDVPESGLRRFLFFMGLPRARQIIVHDLLLSRAELVWLGTRGARIVFDCSTVFPESRQERFVHQCRRAGVCTASHLELARVMNPHCERVRVVPEGVDTGRFVPRSESDSASPLQVGIMGTQETAGALDSVLNRLQGLAGPVQFQVVSEKPYEGPCSDFVFWEKRSEERLVAQLWGMDVGVVPSEENDLSRNVSELLQFMACGIVPVVSAAGSNAEVVDHGIDGFLVDDPSEWEKYVMHLLDDPELRQAMGRAARDKVVSRFDSAVVGRQFWEPW
ncbi:glycosyltransferase family 4 protein [Pseudodesulfovibrio senegalensis]|uniref:Glycosyltransferase family 4 protein n=2 Tax=Pseudodesulfovibrio senegalensis TaxID=1721087 RepID=A0A6N6N5M6_9BACT|nr:glycosyltransferase family 4 protein [Pseudodesulfovibrio senegalensis]